MKHSAPLKSLRSLGLRSDLALLGGEITERQDYLVVRSPGEPSFYYGNLLVFREPPEQGDQPGWEGLFEKEFSAYPEVQHKTFAWDLGASTAIDGFTKAGYHHDQTSVLTTTAIKPPPYPNTEIQIRSLESDAEWDETLALQIATREPEHKEADYRVFAAGRLAAHRQAVSDGEGQWFGAYLGEQQVASLGIFWVLGSGRFQTVATLAEFRRQGICGSLVHHVGKATLAQPNINSLVMLADSEYHAARIYESVGFIQAESIESVCLWP